MDKSEFPQLLERKVIYESEWICLYSDQVQMSDGSVIPAYHKLHFPRESVSCVIFNEKNEILMIQSKRYITNRLEWEIPAGKIEDGETPEQAAKRECWEETGCTLKDVTFLCKHNPSNGMSDLTIHVFAARVHTETMEFDHNEVGDKQWMTKDQVLTLLKENQTQSGVSILAILYALEFYL
ncbi:MAG: NUDIX hydrolase [Massiliimalia sp.]|jgi:mutator protein MutT